MNRCKTGLLCLTALLFSVTLRAQTLEEGKKFIYYERYKSAKSVFEKLVAANPGNLEAVYWLGQSMILPEEKKDIDGAKTLYQKTLMNNSNSALLLAGMGHIELLEGKTQDARNRFETAISLSQAKNKDVLNAVGVANVVSEKGDVEYGVEKLKIATGLKNMKDPDVWGNLGDGYKKMVDGGNAQTAYETALTLNPNYARSSYRIGKIYVTQGQKDIYMRYFEEAIAKDPAYAPVYEALYQQLYTTDVIKSGEYLEKFIANTDEDPRNCYYRASMKYAQGNFADAITLAKECLKAPDAYVKNYVLIGYASNRLGDSVNARSSFETYFSKAEPSVIGPGDWKTYGEILLKFPGEDINAGQNIEKAVAADSTEAGKAALLKVMASYYEGQKKFKEAGDWYSKLVAVKKEPRKTDLYYAGNSYFRAGEYATAVGVFNNYMQRFPDDPFGYYMCGRCNWAIDSTLEQGLANSCFEKAIETGVKDSVKYKSQLIAAYKYFVVYNVYKRDKAAALSFCDKVLALEPTDAEALKNKEIIPGLNFNAPAPKAAASQSIVGKNGEKITTSADGTVTTVAKDGTTTVVTKAGKVTTTSKDGTVVIVENGKVTTITKDGKKTVVEAEGKQNAPKKK